MSIQSLRSEQPSSWSEVADLAPDYSWTPLCAEQSLLKSVGLQGSARYYELICKATVNAKLYLRNQNGLVANDLFFQPHVAIEELFEASILCFNHVIYLADSFARSIDITIPQVCLARSIPELQHGTKVDCFPFETATRYLHRSLQFLNSSQKLFASFYEMLDNEFDEIRDGFGCASGFQSGRFRLISLRIGFREANAHRFVSSLPIQLFEDPEQQAQVTGFYSQRDKFTNSCPTFIPVLQEAFLSTNLRDLVYWLWINVEGNSSESAKSFFTMCKRFNKCWRSWNKEHCKLAREFVGDKKGTNQGELYLKKVNSNQLPDYMLLPFPILQSKTKENNSNEE